jgi:succinoglycan biosynthesis transport protein ExoP
MENESFPASEASQQEESVNLRQYWHVILERRWLVITTFVSVFILCLIYLYKAPRIYQASARLQIDRESEGLLYIKDAFAAESRELDYLQTQYKNLTSRTLIESVIAKLNLTKDDRYKESRDFTQAVGNDITVAPIRLSRLVDIKVEHTDPKKAAAIANELVTKFMENNLDQKRLQSVKTVDWLKAEASLLKATVADADKALQLYMEKFNNVSVQENQNIVLQALKLAQEELIRWQSRAVVAQRVDQKVQSLIKNGTPITNLPQVNSDTLIKELKGKLALKESELANLLKKYREKWPAVMQTRADIDSLKSSIAASAENIVSGIAAEAELAQAQSEAIQKMADQLKGEQLKLGGLRIDFDALNREADLKKILESNILKSLQEMQLQSNSKVNNMRIVDPAMDPFKPIKPSIILTLLMGVLGGLAAGCGLAFFVNYLDDSIKTQEDVEIYLRLPFLGYVPNIKTNSVIERDLQAHSHPQSNASEGFRTIRAAISLMPDAEKFRVFVVTSTIPSEGKSLIASNLAIVTAQTGLRTLLVDADLRRPSVHKAFQLHSPNGLSTYCQGAIDNIDDIIHTTEVPKLSVVCAGAIPNNPSELIGSGRMRQFLDEARKRYDRIFLDCPPISAVSDPLVTASVADGVVFVTKFNKIRREHARRSLQRAQDAGIRVLGVVLNDIDFEGRDSYYYSYYYYQNRYYATHYKHKDKKKVPEIPTATIKGA